MMPKVDYKAVERDVSLKDFKRAYFIYGEEKYLIREITEKLLKAVIGDADSGFDLLETDFDEPDYDAILSYLNTYPTLSERKCVVMRDFNLDSIKSGDYEKIFNLAAETPDSSVLIIVQANDVPAIRSLPADKRFKWNKFITDFAKAGSAVEISRLTGLGIERLAVSWAKGLGKKLSGEVAGKIRSRCGSDLNNLRNEIEKLCSYQKGDVITEESVSAVTVESLEFNVFAACDSIWSGDYGRVYKILDELFYKKEEPIAILAAISSNYVDVYRVKAALQSGYTISDVSEIFNYKNKEFKLKAALANAKNLDIGRIRECIEALKEADEKLKSSPAPQRLVIDLLTFKLINIKRKGAKID